MHKNLKKEANRILLHLAKQCFELRASFIIKNEPEKVEKLKNEESLDNVIKKQGIIFTMKQMKKE
ncbi:hypothetical protein KG807_004282 [Salmonella enterica]|nr:hypothetical protein [Salmonella enterica]EHM8850423.1 hypothetical protein [Salmonella enterica]EHM8926283.1 hypothetical protein [Salmonella enterica]